MDHGSVKNVISRIPLGIAALGLVELRVCVYRGDGSRGEALRGRPRGTSRVTACHFGHWMHPRCHLSFVAVEEGKML